MEPDHGLLSAWLSLDDERSRDGSIEPNGRSSSEWTARDTVRGRCGAWQRTPEPSFGSAASVSKPTTVALIPLDMCDA